MEVLVRNHVIWGVTIGSLLIIVLVWYWIKRRSAGVVGNSLGVGNSLVVGNSLDGVTNALNSIPISLTGSSSDFFREMPHDMNVEEERQRVDDMVKEFQRKVIEIAAQVSKISTTIEVLTSQDLIIGKYADVPTNDKWESAKASIVEFGNLNKKWQDQLLTWKSDLLKMTGNMTKQKQSEAMKRLTEMSQEVSLGLFALEDTLGKAKGFVVALEEAQKKNGETVMGIKKLDNNVVA
jgi:hypothetical protein